VDVQSFVSGLDQSDIRLIPDGDSLIVEPASKLTDEDCAFIVGHKAEILTALARGERNRWPESYRPPMQLRRCGALVCPTCHIHSPSAHKANCLLPRVGPCRSRWFWLSPHGAIKCVACESPADLALVEAWVLARETGHGDGGFGIPGEILSLLHVASPRN
jgi:hypothetical protein